MAFNLQTFRTRTLTAIVFVAVILLGFWNKWTFLILFSVIHFACWWEYLRLIENIHKTAFHIYIKLGLMVTGYGLMLWFCSSLYEINGYGIGANLSFPVSGAGFAVLMIGIFQKTIIKPRALGAAALGLLYISLSWGFMIDFYRPVDLHMHDAMYVLAPDTIPIIIIASIWINDTMAYIVGSIIGKHSLSKISPKKTWEGTIGGVILCVIAVSLLLPLFFHIPGIAFQVTLAIISATAAITGTFGDLLESKLKRKAGLKDSGHLMPGHGGFLDRFDSLLIAIPSVWILFLLELFA